MIISTETIQGVYGSFNTVFNKAFTEIESLYTKVAMVVPSDTRDETYTWLGAVPSMKEWLGSREIKNLSAFGYTLKNRDFELTIGVPRNDIEDDRIGVYKPMFEDLAYSAKRHPDRLVFELFSKGFTEKCFDGKPFFSDNHKSPHLGSKGAEQSNTGTAKLATQSYGAARTQMMILANDEGNPLYIVPDLLVVAPQNEALARTITMSEEINRETNIYKGTAEVLVVPELAGHPAQWFLLCTKRPVKPFIFQNRRNPQLISKNKPDDDNVFFDKEYVFGVDSRCNAGYGLWQLAYGSTGTEEANA